MFSVDNYHSSFRGLRHHGSRHLPVIVSGMMLMGGLSFWLLWQDIWLFRTWSLVFSGLGTWAGIPLGVALSHDNGLQVTVSAPEVMASSAGQIYGVATIALVLFGVSFIVPARNVPCRYLLRGGCLVLGLSVAGYWFADEKKMVDISAYLAMIFRLGYGFIILAPLFFAVMAFTLPGNLVLRLGWVLLAELYLIAILPALTLGHLLLLLWAGPVIMPVTGGLGTIFLLSSWLIAFYGLAASVEEV